MYLWKLLNQLEEYARNLCYIFGKSFCFNESDCHRKSKHFPFQCACNENETLASYVKGYYNAYEVERMEEFIVFKGALEISSYLEHKIDAPYKSESLAILKYCFDNYKDENCYITEHIESLLSQKEETNSLQEPVKEEIDEPESSLDEKEEESDGTTQLIEHIIYPWNRVFVLDGHRIQRTVVYD